MIDGTARFGRGEISHSELEQLQDRALRDTIEQCAATGSPVISDSEQTKSSCASYPLGPLGTRAVLLAMTTS